MAKKEEKEEGEKKTLENGKSNERSANFFIHFFVHVSLYLWNFFNLEIKFLVFRAHFYS